MLHSPWRSIPEIFTTLLRLYFGEGLTSALNGVLGIEHVDERSDHFFAFSSVPHPSVQGGKPRLGSFAVGNKLLDQAALAAVDAATNLDGVGSEVLVG